MVKVRERGEAILLWKNGKTYDEIAAIIGVSKGSLSLWLRNIELDDGIKNRKTETTAARKKHTECTRVKISYALKAFHLRTKLSETEVKRKKAVAHKNLKAHYRLTIKKKLVRLHGNKCSRCGYSKSLSALVFHHRGAKKLKLSDYDLGFEKLREESKNCILLCNNCHRELHYPESVGSRRRIKIQLIQEERPDGCFICGYTKCFGALDFHHLNPDDKTQMISKYQSYEKAREEIKKCVLLCSNCHAEIHEYGFHGSSEYMEKH